MTLFIIFSVLTTIWVYLYWVAWRNYQALWHLMVDFQGKYYSANFKRSNLLSEIASLKAILVEERLENRIGLRNDRVGVMADDSVSNDRPLYKVPIIPQTVTRLAKTAIVWLLKLFHEIREFT